MRLAEPEIIVVVPPAPIVSVADAKRAIGVGSGDTSRDDLIEGLIAAATALIDGPGGWLGRALGRQTLELRRACFPEGGAELVLPYPPIVSVASITYEAVGGSAIVMAPAAYRLDGRHVSFVAGGGWPETAGYGHSLRVQYVAGYENVPPPILQAIKHVVGGMMRFAEVDPRLKKEVVEGIGSKEFDPNMALDKGTMAVANAYLRQFQVWS